MTNMRVRAFEVNAVDYLVEAIYAREASRRHSAGPRAVRRPAAGSWLGQRRRLGTQLCTPIASSSNRAAASSFFPSPIFAGSAPRETTSGFARPPRHIFCARPWPICRSGLDPRGFLRVHRSFIVNLKYVKEVRREANGDSVVILDSGQKVAMGRSYQVVARRSPSPLLNLPVS